MAASLSRPASLPWTSPTSRRRRCLAQILEAVLRGGEIERLRFRRRAGRPSRPDRPAAIGASERADDLVQPLARYEPRRDRLPAGGLLVQHRDVHVAEIGQRQGARDRRRGHDQDVDRLALGAEREALVHAEAVLLVDDGKRRGRGTTTSSWNSAWVPTAMSMLPSASPASDRPALGAAVAAGEERDRKPGPAASGAMRSKCWRARISVGAISAACRPGLDGARHGEERRPRSCPEPTSPWSRRSMRLSATRSRRISATARSCEAVEPKGRARLDRRDEAPVAGVHPPRQASHAAAHEREGELRGQELVIGEAAPRRRALRAPPRRQRLRLARADAAHSARRRRRESRCRRARAASCHSGSAGRRSSAAADELRDHARGQALGQAVDRLDRGQVGQCPARRGCGPDAPSGACRPRARSCRRRSGVGRREGAFRAAAAAR